MKKLRKIGIMGGTFNPIHTGHLILAENAYEQFALDSVLIMPSKNPPHKKQENIVSDIHRSNMISLAIKGNPHFELSTIELEREGTTYTADTLTYLVSNNLDTEYYFIIGADSLFQIDSWKNPEIIFSKATILATTRYHLPDDKINMQIDYLNRKYDTNIHVLNIPNIDLSSELIRERVYNHNTITYYVAREVEQYIYQNKLYDTRIIM